VGNKGLTIDMGSTGSAIRERFSAKLAKKPDPRASLQAI
jgi:hypothetical protein